MVMIPGGKVFGGTGGRIYVGDLGDMSLLTDTDTVPDPDGDLPTFFDVAQWQLQSLYHNAECPHSGCYGAIARRVVAYDFRFSASIPFDYDNPPEQLLNYPQSVGLRFNLADVTQEPTAQALNIDPGDQKFYFAPSALIDDAVPVLDAARDVIRIQVRGSGNSIIFLLPDESDDWNDYKQYLVNRGWLT